MNAKEYVSYLRSFTDPKDQAYIADIARLAAHATGSHRAFKHLAFDDWLAQVNVVTLKHGATTVLILHDVDRFMCAEPLLLDDDDDDCKCTCNTNKQ